MDREEYNAWREKSLKNASLLFTGCSWTYGDELRNRLRERYSKIVSDHYKRPSINLGECGVSNDYIVRNTIEWLEKMNADIVIIQFTVHQRLELFDDNGKIIPCTPQKLRSERESVYYRDVYTDQVGVENLWQNLFLWDSYCKYKGQKYIALIADHYDNALRFPDRIFEKGFGHWRKLCRDIPRTMLNMDVLGLMKQYPKHYASGVHGGHPSALGHKKIADRIIQLIDAI